MTDPVSGGIGKASQQMMQELQRQMQEVQQNQQTTGADSNFGDMVAQKVGGPQQVQQVQQAQQVQETQKATDVLKAAVNTKPTGAPPPGKVEASTESSGIKKLLGQVVEGQNKLDDIIKMATSGKTYGHQDLLAIQASVYKFSQELELTSKGVEKATSGVKQTMQTQV
jgi:hypothetical protein